MTVRTTVPELLVEGAGQIVGISLDGAAKLRAIGARIIIFGRMARGALRFTPTLGAVLVALVLARKLILVDVSLTLAPPF